MTTRPIPAALLAAALALTLSACEGTMTSFSADAARSGQTSAQTANNAPNPNHTTGQTAGQTIPAHADRLATIRLSATVTTLTVGQGAVLSAALEDADGAPLDPLPLTWTSSDPEVLSADGGILRALAAGTAEITASFDQITSEAVTLTVVPAPARGPLTLRLDAAALTLRPQDTLRLGVTVRDAQGQTAPTTIARWHAQDDGVVRVSEDGVLTALTPGSTTVWAEAEGASSPMLAVTVTDAQEHTVVTLLAPTGDTTTDQRLTIQAEIKRVATGLTPGFGAPLMATSAEVLRDGQPAGTLTPGFGLVAGTIDTSAWDAGEAEVRVRVTADGQTFESAPLHVTRVTPAADAWDDLTAGAAYGEDGALFTRAATTHLITLSCGRECALTGHAHNAERDRWDTITYQRQEHRDRSGTIETSTRDDASNIDLPRYTGWGWPSADARQPHAPSDAPALMIAWSNKDPFGAFNQESEPEHYWFDCYVARWDDAAGFDGAGGWRLLNAQSSDYLYRLPHPSTFPTNEQRHPEGVHATRTDDCTYPRLAFEPDETPLVGFIAGPIPGTTRTLHLRAWGGDAWSDRATPYVLGGVQADPRLHALVLDAASQRPIVSVDDGGQPRVLRLDMSDAWQPIPEADAYGITALAALPGGSLLGASVKDGDARVYLGAASQWTPLGGVLDVRPWAQAHEIALATRGGELFVAWTEGATPGNRDLHVARWLAAEARWQRLGDGPVEAAVDQDVSRPSLHLDAQGHLLVRYTVPSDDPDAASNRRHIQRVRRTLSPVITTP